MRGWCHFALTEEQGQRSRGYAVTTVVRYLEALMWSFSGWPETALDDAPAINITDQLTQALDRTTHGDRSTLVNAVASFERYRNGVHPEDQTNLPLREYREADRSSPDLVLPDAYARAKDLLERDGEPDLVLALILQYRAGLRPAEAFGLRVGDVCFTRDRLELIVEANDERDLKTKTSRRIIPLNVLLEDEERALLLARVQARLVASHEDAEAWLLGDELAVSPTLNRSAEALIDAALCEAGGSAQLRQRHLRHSFASYLLATLMLPQDVKQPAIPESLDAVISHHRRVRVSDRLLGRERLGAAALHAVSQVMGHTGPDMTLRFYVHLLDLTLGLYCSRPSALLPLPAWWADEQLRVGPDARRKALSRLTEGSITNSDTRNIYKAPNADMIRASIPGIERKLVDAHLWHGRFHRRSRDLKRRLAVELNEVETPRRRALLAANAPSKPQRKATKGCASSSKHVVPLRRLCACVAGHPSSTIDAGTIGGWQQTAKRLLPKNVSLFDLQRAALSSLTFERFVEKRLTLSAVSTAPERKALRRVVERWRDGKTDIRLTRLADGIAFVQLAKKMGFKQVEIDLALTSVRGHGLPSSLIHRFLVDRSAIPQLAGRPGWAGSIVVRFRPEQLHQPILTARACRFAFTVLAIFERV